MGQPWSASTAQAIGSAVAARRIARNAVTMDTLLMMEIMRAKPVRGERTNQTTCALTVRRIGSAISVPRSAQNAPMDGSPTMLAQSVEYAPREDTN